MILCRVVKANLKNGVIKTSSQRYFATQTHAVASSQGDSLQDALQRAKPFKSLPQPSKFSLLSGYFPGGRFYGKNINEINSIMRRDYGDIFLVPGLFGRNDLVFTFNPEDFKMVFRTEGSWPMRRGIEVIEYYRKTHRPEIFAKAAGLVAEQGERWQHFRSLVNPVMMNPKTFKLYAPKINNITDQFIERIKMIRDPESLEMPATFEEELNFFTMESVSLIALDTKLGLIDRTASNEHVRVFIANIRNFFDLLFKLEMQPSLWKYVTTPTLKKFFNAMDVITDMSHHYVEEGKKRMQNDEARGINKSETEKGVLERLIKINANVAMVMAMDIFLAGVDTTASALVSCLLCLSKNPKKQQKLREEILTILPDKNSELTVEKMSNMRYLRACFKESLRYFPVTTMNFRTTSQEVILSGYRVPANIDVAMPTQEIMREEKYYVHANEYLPERWLRGPEGSDDKGCPLNNNVPFVFLPFGFGPRMCIGKRIVDLEVEVILARLIRNFYIEFNYSTDDAFKTHVINVPAKPLRFKLIDLEK